MQGGVILKKRDVYLDNIPLTKARKIFFEDLRQNGAIGPTEAEFLDVRRCLGRITAAPVFAKISSPHYHAAAMDGIAVNSRVTFGADEKNPKRLREGVDFYYVDTGDPLPPGCDTVIMIEEVHPVGEGEVEIISSYSPWDNVRSIGEDIVATELIVPENHRLRPPDLAAIIAGGHTGIAVRKKPLVAIIPTGTELVSPGEDLKPGDIIEYNSAMLAGYVEEWGGEALVLEKVADDYEKIKARVKEALQKADVVVVNAGSSSGSEDYTALCVKELGTLLVHGVAVRPGKPVILGRIGKKPVVGIPGYPVSAALTMNLFVKPLLYLMQGIAAPEAERLNAAISRRVVSSIGTEEFLRVKLGRIGEKFVASPLSRGAGVITSMVRADGIVRIPALKEGLEAGETVEVELLRGKNEIENTVVIIGSHDVTLDLLANQVKKLYPELNLSSAHVGSMGGIMALKRGEAHMAGIHLLDPDTGEYNLPYIKRYLPEKQIALINLSYRQQGLMVPKGNPRGIRGIQDLKREDIIFVNRQRGAGTRLLLDLKLKELGIDPAEITGYEREDYTHMAVAAAVAGGTADVGLGILAAANALGLDFIPIAPERYDLAVPKEFFDMESVQKVLEVIRTEEFKKKVTALGGYDTSETGRVTWCGS
ncbi:molybdopterin biosynthesis protein [Thermoanaerobacterium sp. DL9XJH110]|uniref:molybdopterin biosynthesis protein n=1 Tax=Thermoanaerobacterium sp. DL9XJH110 TaxID=3386643 RepID=UPI003BB64B03